MAKGASIPTGPAAEDQLEAEGKGRGRRVLPPLTEFPPHVTRETEGKTEGGGAALPEQATGSDAGRNLTSTGLNLRAEPAIPTAVSEELPEAIQAALVEALPEDGEPGDIITACEKRLHAAQLLRDAMEQRTLTAYFHYAGPAVRLAHKGSWRHIIDPTTGKPCRSWSAWLRTVNVSRQHAFRMVKEEPLLEALAGLEGVGALGVRQIDVLSPVLNNYGKDSVRLVWTTAAASGDTSAKALEAVRDQLGFTTAKEVDEDEPPTTATSTPVLRFQANPGTFDEAKVREAARAQPEVALLVARTILAELGDPPAS
ncbi:hypothetical protein [Streptomyces sp.]|uniref:hypothetical protein n=1 Tax=Streptomyces sp. TaxID=1931 RepID=UPI002811E93C|nr:hypothetical protein [Streptomyces sp.]